MPPVGSLLILAFALSLDGFGVGAMYGLRKIRIPFLSVLIISCCSGLIMLLSMKIGIWLSDFVSSDTARGIGAVILMGIGVWTVFQMIMQKDTRTPDYPEQSEGKNEPLSGNAQSLAAESGINLRLETDERNDKVQPVLYLEMKRLGIVIQILRTPAIADVDRSGTISASEAALLGVALSLDAFGAGIGAALVGFSPLFTALLILLCSAIFMILGLRVGFHYSSLQWVRRLSVLPGCILIVMGMMKLM